MKSIVRRSSSSRCKWVLMYIAMALLMKLSYTILYDFMSYFDYASNTNLAITSSLSSSSSSSILSATIDTNSDEAQKVHNKSSTPSKANDVSEQPLAQPSPTNLPHQPSEKSSLETTSSLNVSSSFINDALLGSRIEAEDAWSLLIEEASSLRSKGGGMDPGIFMEVGMFRAVQCLNAAIAGHEAHCVEPSQANFARVKGRYDQVQPEVQARMHLYNVAAGSVTGRELEFHSGGGTGDRVGHVDVWNMEQNPKEEPTAMTKVKEMRMDDIVMKQPNGAFLIKVDTQGFEPHVFTGLEETLKTHAAKFILLEYWPKGMDLMTSTMGNCSAVAVLETLSRAGYHLYQLPVTAHPKAPKEWHVANAEGKLNIPLDDFTKNCQWYYDMEKRFPSSEYKMGYWSDILAVAPSFQLEHPTTKLGKLLFPSPTGTLS